MKRRDFLSGLAVTSAALAAGQTGKSTDPAQNKDAQQNLKVQRVAPKNILICSRNGYDHIDAGFEKLRRGADTLEAAITVVSGPENDPNDDSVGLGGLPNEECVVELDSCCMHGPTRRAGSVGGVRNIKNVSMVGRAVMEHTGHIMLVGEGAERFALAMGFPRENLLTEHSRKIWLLWKEFHSTDDWWGPGLADPHWQPPASKTPSDKPQAELRQDRIRNLQARAVDLGIPPELQLAAVRKVLFPPTGTIHCSALNEKGEISGCTTTSGLAFKLPGRCGDS